jgi:flagellar biosynthetic protein FliQ
MSFGYAIYLVRSSIFQILIMAGPVLLVGLVTGLVVSIVQATTSIQEQTLTFVPKIAAILLAIAFFGPWMSASMVQFTIQLFEQIPQIVR